LVTCYTQQKQKQPGVNYTNYTRKLTERNIAQMLQLAQDRDGWRFVILIVCLFLFICSSIHTQKAVHNFTSKAQFKSRVD